VSYKKCVSSLDKMLIMWIIMKNYSISFNLFLLCISFTFIDDTKFSLQKVEHLCAIGEKDDMAKIQV